MDQVAAITMSDKTAPPTREATPSPSDSKDKKDAAGSAAAAAPAAEGDAAASDAATPAAASSSTPVAPLSQRLYSGNFEEEMGQVMKGLGSFWGGFKARVSADVAEL
jgi:hypothetical protein